MAGKLNGVDTDWARAPPPSGSAWETISKAIYNPDDSSCLGRTPKRWGIMLAFYLIFYAVLALLFAACMGGLLYTLNEETPYYILSESLIGDNPGVAYRPLPLDGFLMRYNSENFTSHHTYIAQLDDFFQPYKNDRWYSTKKGCKADDDYGFPETPCFFIKVNRIFGWKPEYYHFSELPEDTPKDLLEYITNLGPDEQKQIWISCYDEKSNDTKIEYPWGRGLPSAFYPYSNDEQYRSPLVAVRLTPEVNIMASVRCRALAKNIIYNKSLKQPSGYTLIQLHIEDLSVNTTEVPV